MIPYLPESAPFSPAQRAWLNGFFAGMLSGITPVGEPFSLGLPSGSPGPEAAPAPAAPPPPAEETFPWHDPNLALAERLTLAEGKPPARKLMAAMAQLDCGSCGYDCKTYAEAIVEGREKSLKLCSPGGKETADTLRKLVQLAGPATNGKAPAPSSNGQAAATNGKVADPATNGKAAEPTTNGKAADPAGRSAKSPVPARWKSATTLNRPGGEKDVRQVVLDLAGTGVDYEPGDSLGVLPRNAPELVAAVLERLNLAADTVVFRQGESRPAGEWLRERLALAPVAAETVELFAATATDPAEQAELAHLIAEPDALPEGSDLLDLLERFPHTRPAAEALFETLEPLRPRLYSISSSLKAHPGEVHLTIGVVRYKLGERLRKGVASNHLGLHCEPDAVVPVYVQKSHGFRLPADPNVPIVMIGPGTGIAPFRAFLEERHATQAGGRNWLFFGDQRSNTDFLYENELTAWRDSGLLTRLDTAFSRDGAEKVYVQHRMLERAAELRKWLDEGAHIYVCGDAKRMAKDVDRALQEILRTQAGLTEAAAKETLAAWSKQGRYARDVY